MSGIGKRGGVNAKGPLSPNKLAVFDIDGTLVHSLAADTACFVQAFADALGIDDIDTDWARYDHTTDPGITEQLFHERLGRAPRDDEVARIQARFVELLDAAAERADAYPPLPGAAKALRRLAANGQWAVALATGAWRACALLKLGRAGLDVAGLPAAYGEDGPSRDGIVGAAIGRARERYGVDGFTRTVSVGDAVWDVRAAARLGLAFVGIGAGEPAARLRADGVSHVVPDFVDTERFFAALEEATVPLSG